jgi:hypothetical protein
MINIYQKVLFGLLITGFISTSYAINVNVHSTSSSITGLGFKANGSKHGGMGQNYEGKDMPKGSYAFGVRVKGKDVPCLSNGKRNIKLTKDTDATLVLKGGKCTVTVE